MTVNDFGSKSASAAEATQAVSAVHLSERHFPSLHTRPFLLVEKRRSCKVFFDIGHFVNQQSLDTSTNGPRQSELPNTKPYEPWRASEQIQHTPLRHFDVVEVHTNFNWNNGPFLRARKRCHDHRPPRRITSRKQVLLATSKWRMMQIGQLAGTWSDCGELHGCVSKHVGTHQLLHPCWRVVH